MSHKLFRVAIVASMIGGVGYAATGCSDPAAASASPGQDAGAVDSGSRGVADAGAMDSGSDGRVDGGADAAGDAGASSCAPAPTSSLVVNVRDKGATGNGVADDTAAIQAAIDQVGGTGGTVRVPDGTYMIDAVTRLKLASNMTFRMTSGAILKAIANDQTSYAIIYVGDASGVNVVGGTVQGERAQHQGTTGEWGMGIWISGSHNVVIEGVAARDCWGDGFYQAGGGPQSTNITLCGVVAENNRRQGLSIENVDGMVIQDSIFEKTNGTAPQAGIDIEPFAADQVVSRVRILRSRFLDNLNFGIVLWAGSGSVVDVTVDGSSFTGNAGGILFYKTDGHRITNDSIVDQSEGIHLEQSTGNVITGNTITAPNPIVGNAGGNTMSGNSCNGSPCP